MRRREIKQSDYLSLKYEDPHKHHWFSAFGAPMRCYLCGVGKEIHDAKVVEKGFLKSRVKHD